MTKWMSRLALSLLIGALMLYLALRNVDFVQLGQALRRARWLMVLPYFAVMALQHFIRSWRWGYLLEPIHPVPMRRLLPVASVGFLAILALPLRTGEFVRPYLVADPPRLRMSQAMGTLAVERVVDGLILAFMTFVAVTFLPAAGVLVPSWLKVAGYIAMGLFSALLVVLLMTWWQRERAVTLCRRLIGIVSTRVADVAAHVAEGIVDGFRVLPDIRRLSVFSALTAAYWLLNGLAFWIVAWGFGLDVSYVAATGIMAIIGVGIMVPAGPGFAGNFELFAHGALSLYVSQALLVERGMAFVLTSHVLNAAWYAVAGLIAMASPEIHLRKNQQKLDSAAI